MKQNPEFDVHTLNDTGKLRAKMIRDAFDVLVNELEDLCTPGREMSIVKTKLEEACFFAKKSMAKDNCQ